MLNSESVYCSMHNINSHAEQQIQEVQTCLLFLKRLPAVSASNEGNVYAFQHSCYSGNRCPNEVEQTSCEGVSTPEKSKHQHIELGSREQGGEQQGG